MTNWRYLRLLRLFYLFLLLVVIFNIGPEQVMNVPDILGLESFLIGSGIIDKPWVQKVLSAIIMIHTNVFQLELNDDTVVGQVMRELNQLIPEILDKLIVDVRYPCL